MVSITGLEFAFSQAPPQMKRLNGSFMFDSFLIFFLLSIKCRHGMFPSHHRYRKCCCRYRCRVSFCARPSVGVYLLRWTYVRHNSVLPVHYSGIRVQDSNLSWGYLSLSLCLCVTHNVFAQGSVQAGAHEEALPVPDPEEIISPLKKDTKSSSEDL